MNSDTAFSVARPLTAKTLDAPSLAPRPSVASGLMHPQAILDLRQVPHATTGNRDVPAPVGTSLY